MATGTAPGLDPNIEPKNQTTEAATSQPETFAQRFKNLLHKIFAGREEHLGWHQ